MQESRSWLAYVGCRTTRERQAQGRGLGVWRVDGSGAWTPVQLVEGLRNPSYLCLHPTQPRLYAVHGDFSEISSYAIGRDGLLARLGEQSTQGRNPVHLALTPSSRWLLVANYASGSVACLPVDERGDLGPATDVLALPGVNGPHPQQVGSHPHQVCFTPDGRHAMVPDKGLDQVFTLTVDEVQGRLAIAATLAMPAGTGPRHMAFHSELPLAYLVGELDRTVTTLRVDRSSGRLQPLALASTVPAGVDQGSAAGIVVSREGRRLYVSNRGHDSVAAFDIAAEGSLGEPTWLPAGKTPRFITQLPAGGPLLVAREEGHCIAALQDATSHFNDLAHTGSPVCIVFRKENP